MSERAGMHACSSESPPCAAHARQNARRHASTFDHVHRHADDLVANVSSLCSRPCVFVCVGGRAGGRCVIGGRENTVGLQSSDAGALSGWP